MTIGRTLIFADDVLFFPRARNVHKYALECAREWVSRPRYGNEILCKCCIEVTTAISDNRFSLDVRDVDEKYMCANSRRMAFCDIYRATVAK